MGWLLLAAPAAVQAQFTYSTNADNTLNITGYYGPSGAVAIPDAINGLAVSSIGQEAFYDDTSLTGVTIPGSVISIGDSSFLDCANLNSVTIGNGVTCIGSNAFYQCGSLTNVIIPGSVTNIAGFAFSVSGLTSVTIPGSLTSMGDCVFEASSSLSKVYFYGNAPTAPAGQFSGDYYLVEMTGVYYLPGTTGWGSFYAGVPAQSFPAQAQFTYTTNGGTITITGFIGPAGALAIPTNISGLTVTGIEDQAFYDQIGLTSITIPRTVTSIGVNAFEYCANLTAITVDANNSAYSSVNGVVFNKGQTTLIQYPPGLSGGYTIPDTVTSIGNYGFDGCSGLTIVIIPAGLTSIGAAAFAECASLANVTIPQAVTSIGQGAFYDCGSLTSITIPSSVTNIGEYAFQACGRLTNVTVANGVTSIGEYAFYESGSLTSITIPASVTNIGQDAFAWCSSLATVTIPSNVKTIGDYAFAWCGNLTSVTNPASINSVGYGLFTASSNLTSVYFQGNAPTVVGNPFDGPVFSGDSNVTVYYSPCTTGWNSTFGGVSAVPEGLVYTTNAGAITITGYSNLCPNIIIPASINGLPVSSIGASAFENLTNLTSVTLTAITNIGPDAFEGCSGLTGVYFNGNAPTADVSAFNNDIKATVYYTPCATGWTNAFAGLPTVPETTPDQFSYTINAGAITITGYSGSCGTLIVPAAIDGLPVTTIGSNAFENLTNLASVTIPGSVTSIGEAAFAYCTGLTDTTISPGINSIGQGAFYGCSSLSVVTIPASVTNIGEYAFQLCNGLTNITLANGVTSIGEYAFYGSSLTSVTIPASVTHIGQNAFADCAGLTTVTIPSGVNTIGDDAFAWCSGLISVTLPATVTNIGYALFYGSSNLTSVYFQGDAPAVVGNSYDGAVFDGDASVTVYYSFCTFGWGSTFAGVSAVPEGLSFTTNAGAITVTGYSSLCPYVIIPASINGLPITSIGANAFANLTNLTSVTIPASVTNVGANAFEGCSSLTGVYFNGNAPPADATVFNADTKATVYYAPCASGWSNTFAGLPAIPGTAPDQFIYTINAGAITLTGYPGTCADVNIPATIEGVPITGIAAGAFYGHNTLTSLTIPATVTEIEGDMFTGTSLTNISFLGNVTIGPNAFDSSNRAWDSLTSVNIAGGVIGDRAFQFCESLSNLTLGNGVTSIGQLAFIGDPISNLVIPASVTSISSGAFEGCAITNLMIPGSVTNLDFAAFYGCGELTNVVIGAGVATIWEDSFSGCGGLISVFFLGNAPTVLDTEDEPVFYDDPKATIYYLPGTTGWSSNYQCAPTALWEPLIQGSGAGFGVSNNQFGFNITGTANIPIVVEGCTNLANPVWTPLTNVALTNGQFYFSEPCQANTLGRYYRIGFP